MQAEGDLHADGHKAYDRERRRDGARKTRPESRCDNDYGGIARDSQCTNHRNPRRSQHNTTLESRVYAARPENRRVQPIERAPGRTIRLRSRSIRASFGGWSAGSLAEAHLDSAARRRTPGALFFSEGSPPGLPYTVTGYLKRPVRSALSPIRSSGE